MKSTAICASLTVILAAQPMVAQAQHLSASQETNLKREGIALLSKWGGCKIDNASTLAMTAKVSSADVVVLAMKACSAEREAWIESQTALGWPRYAAEQAADGSEQCEFALDESYVDLIRHRPSQIEKDAWQAAHAGYSCRH